MTHPDLSAGDLTLRELDPARDAEALHAAFGDKATMTYWSGPAFAAVGDTRAQLEEWAAQADSPQWTIFNASGTALGRVTLVRTAPDVADAGIVLTPSARGKGVARAALDAAVAYGFDVLKLARITADIDPENTASVRLFKQAGFVFETRRKGAWTTHLGVRDSLIFVRRP